MHEIRDLSNPIHHTKQIDLFSYINCDWESQPMWHNVGFGDTRLSSNPEVLSMWHDFVINGKGSQKFLMAGALSDCVKLEVTTIKSGYDDVGFGVPLACLFVSFLILIKIYATSNIRRQRGAALEETPLIGT